MDMIVTWKSSILNALGCPFGVHILRVVDMPAHVRTALTQMHLSIPFLEGQLALGQWQGVFLYEHRHIHNQRRVIFHLIGE